MSSLELKSMESTLISPTLFSDGLNTSVEICLHFPPNVNSGGLWIQHDDARWWLKSTLPLLELQLALYFLILAILRFLLKPFRIPKLSIQILVSTVIFKFWPRFITNKANFLSFVYVKIETDWAAIWVFMERAVGRGKTQTFFDSK